MERSEILKKLWAEQDEAFELMTEYDSLPHHYGEDVLYQAEAYIVHEIGDQPNITTTEIAAKQKKTTSACSQIVKKLIAKGLVEQTRNEENKRIYNLTLTKDGERLYKDHVKFNEMCQGITFDLLSGFTDEELEIHTRVQNAINKAYRGDVERSKAHYSKKED